MYIRESVVVSKAVANCWSVAFCRDDWAKTMAQQLTKEEKQNVKTVIERLKQAAYEERPLDRADVVWLLERVEAIFRDQPMLLEIDAPMSICGDVHGQFRDLLRLFDLNGWPPASRYLFLGDYVDRGPMNLETICLLFALKVLYPNDFYILRGNHETRSINRAYGFHDEISVRYDTELYEQFNTVFTWIPISALVAGRVLCMHGGLSPDLKSLDQIRNIPRPLLDAPDAGLVADLLWADPDKNVTGWVPSPRGISYQFGRDVVIDMCDALGLDLIARAHQVVNEGYEFFADDRLVTLFSAPDYCNMFNNAGGMLLIDEEMTCRIKQIPSMRRM